MEKGFAVATRRVADTSTSYRRWRMEPEIQALSEYCVHRLSRSSKDQLLRFHRDARASLTRRDCRRCNSKLLCARAPMVDCHRVLSVQRSVLIARLLKQDRKSTRLNSSHGYISYAVFCLKKK